MPIVVWLCTRFSRRFYMWTRVRQYTFLFSLSVYLTNLLPNGFSTDLLFETSCILANEFRAFLFHPRHCVHKTHNVCEAEWDRLRAIHFRISKHNTRFRRMICWSKRRFCRRGCVLCLSIYTVYCIRRRIRYAGKRLVRENCAIRTAVVCRKTNLAPSIGENLLSVIAAFVRTRIFSFYRQLQRVRICCVNGNRRWK